MSVANQLRQLLETHGDSAVAAARRSGVARETIRRILNGHKPPKLPLYLRKIALAYGLDERALLDGASPRGEFEWQIRNAPPVQQREWLFMSIAERVKLTLDFLRVGHSHLVSTRTLAIACGMTQEEFLSLLERWEIKPPDRATASMIANVLHELTGISASWFRWGTIRDSCHVADQIKRLSVLAQPVRGPRITRTMSQVIELATAMWS